MKKFAMAFALLAASVSTVALAQVGSFASYCGTFEGQFAENPDNPDASIPLGMKVTISTNRNVQQVIRKYGSHNIEFTYADAVHMKAIAEEVSAFFQRHDSGQGDPCIFGEVTAVSRWGTPTEILPLRVLP